MTDITNEPQEGVDLDNHDNELQVTEIVVLGEYGDHRPYEQRIKTHVLLAEGDGVTLSLQVINAYVIKPDAEE